MSNKHLIYDGRLVIQIGLQQGLKVVPIAKNIGKNRSTVSRAIKAHCRLIKTSGGNACNHWLHYRLRRMLYDAKYAQQQYEQILSEPRKGILLRAEIKSDQ